jgi:hypothetical protein
MHEVHPFFRKFSICHLKNHISFSEIFFKDNFVPLNFNLEYSTRNENWRLKMFSRSNNLLLQQSGSITNGVSGNTLGGGALYRREFETFRRKKTPITTTTEEKPVE